MPSQTKDTQSKDCYKSLELIFLALLYGVLTALYVTASTLLQFIFLFVVSVTVCAAKCRDWACLRQAS